MDVSVWERLYENLLLAIGALPGRRIGLELYEGENALEPRNRGNQDRRFPSPVFIRSGVRVALGNAVQQTIAHMKSTA